jgi:hypothetical protein
MFQMKQWMKSYLRLLRPHLPQRLLLQLQT